MKWKMIKDLLEVLGLLCVVLTFFFILCVFIVIVSEVLGEDITQGDIIFFTIIVGGAMNYIIYKLNYPLKE